MEFWEGAILVVGGVWLVRHMTRNSGANVSGVPAQGTAVVAPLSNSSDLTTFTNVAAGYPVVAGEPLQAPQTSLVPIVSSQSSAASVAVTPVRTLIPVSAHPGSPTASILAPTVSAPIRGTIFRPAAILL